MKNIFIRSIVIMVSVLVLAIFFVTTQVKASSETFRIGIFWPPPSEYTNDTQYDYLKDAHINTVMYGNGMDTVAKCQAVLDLCAERGMKCIVGDSRFEYQANCSDADIDAMAADYKDHAATVGYYVRDEPGMQDFDWCAHSYNRFLYNDFDAVPYVNLNPSYGLTSSYKEYLQEWIDTVGASNLKYLCYDFYPFMWGSGIRGDYYYNLQAVRDAGISNGVKTECFLQSSSNLGTMRLPDEEELRWNVYTCLAYGMKGLFYFTWWQPNDNMTSIIDSEGNKTDLYTPVQTLNAQVEMLGPTLMDLESKEIYHAGTFVSGAYMVPDDYFWQPATSYDQIISHFESTSGRDYVMIVNRDFSNSRTLSFNIDAKPAAITEISKTTGQQTSTNYSSTTGEISDTFLPGEGKLYLISSDFAAPTPTLTPTPTPSPTPTPVPTTVLSDDFSGDLSNWTYTANCSIANGQLQVANTDFIRSADGGSYWTNYSFEADVNVTTNAAGLVFRSVDSNNFYMWQLNAEYSVLKLHKKVDGNWTVLKEVSTPISLNTVYHTKIEANGSTIKTYIDGTLIDTTVDTTFSSGRVGFREAFNESALFDNAVVNRIPLTLMEDDFSSDLSKWADTTNCSVSNGVLLIAGTNESINSANGGTAWTDYAFECDAKINSGTAGLVFRRVDGNNYYMWQFNAVMGKLRPHKKVNGSWTVIKEVDTPILTDTEYHIKIEVIGSIIKTYVDGTLVDTTTDSTFSYGKVGFREDCEEIEIDDVVVSVPLELLVDDFSGDLSKWVNTSNCSISNGQLTVADNNFVRNANGSGWTNYILEADVNVAAGAAGLVFRSVDNNNFYMWQLNAVNSMLRPHKMVNGNWSVIKEVAASIALNTTYHVKIEVFGSTIKTYIDGTLVDTTTDITFSSGGVGFREAFDEEAVFDNVVVGSL